MMLSSEAKVFFGWRWRWRWDGGSDGMGRRVKRSRGQRRGEREARRVGWVFRTLDRRRSEWASAGLRRDVRRDWVWGGASAAALPFAPVMAMPTSCADHTLERLLRREPTSRYLSHRICELGLGSERWATKYYIPTPLPVTGRTCSMYDFRKFAPNFQF